MPNVTAEAVIKTLHDLYDYEITPADAEGIARSAGALLTVSGALKTLGIDGVEAPFGFPVMASEAARISKPRRARKGAK